MKNPKFQKMVFNAYLVGIVIGIILVSTGIIDQKPPVITSWNNKAIYNNTPDDFELSEDGLTEIESQLINNESSLANLANSGDGQSWETAYVIENVIFTRNNSQFLLSFENINHYVIIANCSFNTNINGPVAYALYLENCTNFKIQGCEFKMFGQSGNYAIYISNSSQIRIENCKISKDKSGLEIRNSQQIDIINSQFAIYSYPITIYHSKDVNCIGNNFFGDGKEEQGDFEYFFNGHISVSAYNITNMRFEENNLYNYAGAITFNYLTNGTISKNRIYFLYISNTINTTINSNLSNGGFHIYGAQHIKVQNNIMQGGDYSLTLKGIKDIQIDSNIISNYLKLALFYELYMNDNLGLLNDIEGIFQNNTVYLSGTSHSEYVPENLKFNGNLIIGKPGHIISSLVILFSLSILSYTYIFFKKKKKILELAINNLEKREEYNAVLYNLRKIKINEGFEFQLSLFWLMVLNWVYFQYSISILDSISTYYGKESILGIQLLGILIMLFSYVRLRKTTHKIDILGEMDYNFTSREFIILGSIILLIGFCEILMVSQVIIGRSHFLVLLAGIISIGGFLVNSRKGLQKREKYYQDRIGIWIKLILFFFISYFYMNTITFEDYPDRFERVRTLIYISAVIIGIFGNLRVNDLLNRKIGTAWIWWDSIEKNRSEK